jgi:hypothetical protein
VPVHAKLVAVLGLSLVAVSEFLQWLSDLWKSAAHQLHRKLDFEDSFGWKITDREMKDFLARYAGNIESFAAASETNFFASDEQPGSKRAVENLRESAWWSMHLSETMWWTFVTAIVVILLGCLFLLNVSVQDVSQTTTQVTSHASDAPPTSPTVDATVVKVVTSTVLFIFSYGLFKFAIGYFSFRNKSRQIADTAEGFLKNGPIDKVQAIKLWQDYHLARDLAPLIPKSIWKIRQKKLNKIWQS